MSVIKTNLTRRSLNRLSFLFLAGIMLFAFQARSQVRVPFEQRESAFYPGQKSYTLKGDFVMIGNTNLTLESYDENANNSGNMVYVDVDGNPDTWNSSSATLGLPMENDAIPACSQIVFAGLYWTGRAHDGESPNIFTAYNNNILDYDNPQTANLDIVAAHEEAIPHSNYTLTISRSGLSTFNNRTLTYTFTSTDIDANTVAFVYAHNSGNQTLTVSVNGGTPTNVPTSSIDANNAYLSNPYVIYSDGEGITISMNRFYRDGRNSNVDPARAYVNVSGTYYPPISRTMDKSIVQFKHQAAADYTTISAVDAGFSTNIYYPTNTDGSMYVGYAEVTDYVRQYGVGEYMVADIALRQGDGGGMGYYGGWGMIVVYENSLMNWREISIFDGFAFVQGVNSHELDVTGFTAIPNGTVSVRVGFMAGEGDRGISGDFLDIQELDTDNFIRLSHAGNTIDNFFNSSIVTGSNERNPNLANNTGIDIASFQLPNDGNSIIGNNQTATKFRYGTTQDAYSIFMIAFSVEAYVPEQVSENAINSINGVPPGEDVVVFPGQEVEFTLEIQNAGSEAVNDAQVRIPIPYTAEYVSSSVEYFYTGHNGLQPVFNPSSGATGAVILDIGHIPMPEVQGQLMARMTYKFRVTEDCFILSNPNCEPYLTINGTLTSVGVISGSTGVMGFIQGYRSTGECTNEPITDPLSILIDRTDFINNNCQPQENYTTRSFSYCNVPGDAIPFSDVFGFFPSGSRFFNNLDRDIEYTSGSGFPATEGVTTYYAIPPGITTCWWEFTIDVFTLDTQPTTENLVYCQNHPAVPLTAVPTNSSYLLYYYTNDTGGTPSASMTPPTVITGITSYWVAEAVSAQCISPNRAEIEVTVLEAPECSITGDDGPFCPGASIMYSAPTGMKTYSWNISGNGSIAGSINEQTVTVITGSACGESFVLTLTVTNDNDCPGICQKEVFIQDNTPPVFTTTPSNLSVECDGEGNQDELNNWLANVAASDNCALAGITHNFISLNSACGSTGSGTVIWTATDVCGNTATTSATFTITDNTNPVFTTIPENITLECDGSGNTAQISSWLANIAASDVCGSVEITNDYAGLVPGCGNTGTATVTWTAADACGNTITTSATVTVEDNTPPVFTTAPVNLTLECDGAGNTAAITAWLNSAVASDVCGSVSITHNYTGLSDLCGATGTATVTWTADRCLWKYRNHFGYCYHPGYHSSRFHYSTFKSYPGM
jgi:hypothetical protein